MRFPPAILCLIAAFCFLLCSPAIPAQQAATGSIHGQVTDPSGATVANATVLVGTPDGTSITATTNQNGVFDVPGLPAGKYNVKVFADGFATFEAPSVDVAAGQQARVNVSLKIQEQEQKVEVTDSTTKVDVNPENNASMVVLKGKDLEALSDDPDELQSELQALAGPSAGPNGGQIYIDGFTAGQLPPKASIREIRVNQNPFSAEYDKLGYGRIEILTKPGTDQWHGQAFLTGNTAGFNSRNPFESADEETAPPGYESTQFSVNIGGPLSKKASMFFNLERRDIHDLSVVNATILDPNFIPVSFSDSVINPRTRTNLSPRLDYQLTPSNTLTARYQYERNDETNDGIGGFKLASLGINELSTEQTLQVTDSQIIGAKVVNETRFQFIRATTDESPQSLDPTISVQGAFTNGGSTAGRLTDVLDRYELQNYTSMTQGKHYIKFGARIRANRDVDESTANFNGQFTFGPPPNPINAGCPDAGTVITGLEAFRQLQIGLANPQQGLTPEQNLQRLIACGFGATQFSITQTPVAGGSPQVQVNWFDTGLYVQDDWRIRPNITASYGLRFETQNHLSDHHDFAPRLGIAWGVGGNAKKAPIVVIRGGFGIFYDRFTYDLILQQQRLNGLVQQQFVVLNPQFFLTDLPSSADLQQSGTPATTFAANNSLRTPYTMQTGISVERQLGKNANLAVTYLHSRGVHQFFTNDINAPDPNTGVRPDPSDGTIFQFQSEGVFKQNQLIVNSSVRLGTKVSLFGYYTYNRSDSDTNGPTTVVSDPFNLSNDFGRAAFDIRHRLFFGGTIGLPHGFRVSPFMIASSGIPFNITDGLDPFADQSFNARPSFAVCTGSPLPDNIVQTPFGCFNKTPGPGEALIPANFAEGPGRFTMNVRLSKTFGFGKKAETAAQRGGRGGQGGGGGGTFGAAGGRGGPGGGGGPRGGGFGGGDSNTTGNRYSLTLSVSGRNIFNNVNELSPVGDLSSPIFGESNGLAGQPYSSSTANRRVDLQITFTF